MQDLITNLETMVKPSQELDALILAHLVGGTVEQSRINGNWCVYTESYGGKARLWEPRTDMERAWKRGCYEHGFTRSLDAALTLVPEGWKVIVGQGNIYRTDNPGTFWVAEAVRVFVDPSDGKPNYQEIKSRAPTPALALCVAALKARQGAPACGRRSIGLGCCGWKPWRSPAPNTR